MPKKQPTKKQADQTDSLLLEPALVALHKDLRSLEGELQRVVAAIALPPHGEPDPPAGGGTEPPPPAEGDCSPSLVQLTGSGAPAGGGGCQLPASLLMRASAYYQHAAAFGAPPSSLTFDFGDRCVRLLGAALLEGSAELGPGSVAELLQAASFLQVASVLDACSAYLQAHLLERQGPAVLRVALDLGLSSLAAHIEADFLQDFYMLSGEKAALLLREWPAGRRAELLGSPRLQAPTECCLVETLCHLAKAASSADALPLLGCLRLQAMSPHELAAAALYLQHNSKWVDRRLSTALAWRLLNARVAADLSAWPANRTHWGAAPLSSNASSNGAEGSGSGSRTASSGNGGGRAGEPGAHPRQMQQRCLVCGLSTARLAAWAGTAMFLAACHIPCSFDPPEGPTRPLVLQLEREDPRHNPAESVGGTTGRAGRDTDSGGAGWDVQLSRDPERFPAGFQAVCFAFGRDGLFWCRLGPLAKPGPTWWKVGFLASQLPRALPTAPALAALAEDGGGSGGLPGLQQEDDGLLLVGWWVPKQ